jgi:hypothetical protein
MDIASRGLASGDFQNGVPCSSWGPAPSSICQGSSLLVFTLRGQNDYYYRVKVKAFAAAALFAVALRFSFCLSVYYILSFSVRIHRYSFNILSSTLLW